MPRYVILNANCAFWTGYNFSMNDDLARVYHSLEECRKVVARIANAYEPMIISDFGEQTQTIITD